MRPTIGYMGSCRVATPLGHLQAAGALQLQRKRNYGFVHSAPEIDQLSDVLMGGDPPEAPIWPYISRRANRADIVEAPVEPPDIMVVELSSTKTFWIDDTPVQSNYLLSSIQAQSTSRVATALRTHLKKNDLDGFLRQFGHVLPHETCAQLERLMLTETKDSVLSNTLTNLADTYETVVIVPHIDCRMPDGQTLRSRSVFRDQVIDLAGTLGLALFDPTELLSAVGQSASIADNSQSFAHFTDAFSKLWAREFGARYLNAVPNVRTPLEVPFTLSRGMKTSAKETDGKPLALWDIATPKRATIDQAQALLATVLSDEDASKTAKLILGSGDHLPASLIAHAVQIAPAHVLRTHLAPDHFRALVAMGNIETVLRAFKFLDNPSLNDRDVCALWSAFVEQRPSTSVRFQTLVRLADHTPLPDRVIAHEQRALRRISKDALERQDATELSMLARLDVEGLDIPAEVHLYCARLAYFNENWTLSVEQGLIALNALPNNLGGWIRLNRAAKALGLHEIIRHAEQNIETLEGARP
ncbi:MAG: hypothetical protein AAGJ34_08400 [Pseudomonadota bacterium]